MADDANGLLVQIGVTQARMERELAKLVKDAAKSAGDMEKSFNGANDNIGKNAAKAFNGVARGANAAAPAVKNVGGYTANLAAQLNDISVQLAGGQSPFQIMLQQGTQIGQVAAQAGGGLRGLGSLLVGAFQSVLSPVNLLTFAVIGLGGYAVQYFASIISNGSESNKVLEEQQKLIEGVAKTWGDAVPALQAYVDTLATAKDAADLIKASDTLAGKSWDVARSQIDDLNVSFAVLLQDLRAAGESDETILAISNAFQELRQKVEAGTATTADMDSVTKSLAETMYSNGIPSLGDFETAFSDLGSTIAGATAQALKFQQEALNALTVGKNGPKLGTLSPLFSDNGKIINESDVTPSGTVPTPGTNPLRNESLNNDDIYGKPKKSRSGGRGANAYKDEVANIKERTAALQASTAAQAAINPLVDDYGRAAAKASAEQRLLADAERAKMKITPQLREDISNLAGAYADATVEAKKLAESQDEIRQRAEEWANLEKDVLGGFIKDLTSGKSAADAFADALGKIGNKLLDMAFDDMFSTKSGSGGGSGLSGLLGGIGKIFGFASGTANTGGKRGQPMGVVHGQEAVIPLPAGGKVPVSISTPSASDLGGARTGDSSVSINIPIDATGADAAGLARVQQEIASLKKTLPTTIIDTVNNGQRRRLIQ